ncbi:LOW QUALITY PROTEIN: uncharacterized protein WM294_014361 [Sarcoramphus papa]
MAVALSMTFLPALPQLEGFAGWSMCLEKWPGHCVSCWSESKACGQSAWWCEESGRNKMLSRAPTHPSGSEEESNNTGLHLGLVFCLYCCVPALEILGLLIPALERSLHGLVSLLENCCLRAVSVCLGQCRSSIKAGPSPPSLIHSSRLPPWNKVHLRPRDMSCYNQCLPCQPCGPTPLANSCNEPCVRQCQDSTVAIQPPAVVVTLPGPILSSFPQSTAVGSSTSAAVGSILSSEGVPISSGGFGLSGFGGRLCGRRCLPC